MGSNSEDLGRSASPEASGISRRTLIRAAGALGIAATALGALPASRAGAASGSQFLGSNLDTFDAIRSGQATTGTFTPVPGFSGVRMYGSKPTNNGDGTFTSNVASTWPQPIPHGSTTPVANPGPIVYSIYPLPEDVIDGSLFHVLTGLIDSAPPNSYLNCWHEALSLTGDNQYPGITSDNLYLVHRHLNTYVTNSSNSANVTYGSIFGGKDADLPMLFESVPPNLGFYGQDLYATGSSDPTACSSGIAAGMQHLEDFITQAAAKDTTNPGGYPKIMIPECNYAPDCSLLGDGGMGHPGDKTLRKQWFEAVATRMHQYGSNAIGTLTFWRAGGSLSGDWDPSQPWGPSTISAFIDITQNIF